MKNVRIRFDSEFSGDNIKSFVKEFQSQLDKIEFKVPDTKTDLEDKAKKVTQLVKEIEGFSFAGGDVQKFQTLATGLENSLSDLRKEAQKLASEDFTAKMDKDSFGSLVKQLENARKELEKAQLEADKLFSQQIAEDRITAHLTERIKSIQDAREEVIKLSEPEDLTPKDYLKEDYEKFAFWFGNRKESMDILIEQMRVLKQENMSATQKSNLADSVRKKMGIDGIVEGGKGGYQRTIAYIEEATTKLKGFEDAQRRHLQVQKDDKKALEDKLALSRVDNADLANKKELVYALEREMGKLQNMQKANVQKGLLGISGEDSVHIKHVTQDMADLTATVGDFSNTTQKALGQQLSNSVVRFGAQLFGVQKIAQSLTNQVKQALDTYVQLDKHVTSIAMVSGTDRLEEWKGVGKFNAMARDLGATTKDIAQQAEGLARQGRTHEETLQMINATTQMGSISNLSYADSLNYLTASVNGFKLEASESNMVVDTFSRLDAKAATSVEELAIALSKTSSIASSANMDFKSTTAMLATMIETTREAPKNVVKFSLPHKEGNIAKTIILEYKSGKSVNYIAKKYKKSWGTIKRILTENGVKTISKRNQYTVGKTIKDNVFDVIDTEESAYWLGYLYADGSIRKKGNEVALESIDYDIIEKFHSFLESKCSIREVTRTLDGKEYKTYATSFSSSEVKTNLIKLGCIPNKSLVLKCPTIEQVPDNLFHHFFRGYVDGDGYIQFEKRRYRIVVCGTQAFLEGSAKRLNLKHFKIRKDNQSKIYILNIERKKEVKDLLEKLYGGAKVYMNRKEEFYHISKLG